MNEQKTGKDIKDYLHLYLGCDCLTDDGRRGWFSGFDICEKDYSIVMITVRFPGSEEDWSVLNDNDECDRIKLILRPLSDMTDQEMDEVWYGEEPRHQFAMHYKNSGNVRTISLCSERTRYFLSKGFDLFGLIEAGLAIDKTKL